MNGFRSCAGNSTGRIRELEDIAKLLTQTPLDAIRLVLVQNARGLRLRDHWKIRNQILFASRRSASAAASSHIRFRNQIERRRTRHPHQETTGSAAISASMMGVPRCFSG
jgi:hypothetical protein